MSNKSYRDPFAIHSEHSQAAREEASITPTPNLSGDEIACTVGGYRKPPIPVLYNPATRTTFPVRNS